MSGKRSEAQAPVAVTDEDPEYSMPEITKKLAREADELLQRLARWGAASLPFMAPADLSGG